MDKHPNLSFALVALTTFALACLALGVVLLVIELWHAWRQRRWIKHHWGEAERRSAALRALTLLEAPDDDEEEEDTA